MRSKLLIGLIIAGPLAAAISLETHVAGQVNATARPKTYSPARVAGQPTLNLQPEVNSGEVSLGETFETAVTPETVPIRARKRPGPSEQLLRQDFELEVEVQNAVHKFAGADDDESRASSRQILSDLLNKQFALRQQRREQEIAEIEERVKRLRDALQKRGNAQQTIVERRLNQLLSESEGLGWGEVGDGRAGAAGVAGAAGFERRTVPSATGTPGTYIYDGPLPNQRRGSAGVPGRPATQTYPGAFEAPLPAKRKESKKEGI